MVYLLKVLPSTFSDGYFNEDAKYNLCYCESCHKLRGDEAYYKRGEPPRDYALPFGWCRFALRSVAFKLIQALIMCILFSINCLQRLLVCILTGSRPTVKFPMPSKSGILHTMALVSAPLDAPWTTTSSCQVSNHQAKCLVFVDLIMKCMNV